MQTRINFPVSVLLLQLLQLQLPHESEQQFPSQKHSSSPVQKEKINKNQKNKEREFNIIILVK